MIALVRVFPKTGGPTNEPSRNPSSFILSTVPLLMKSGEPSLHGSQKPSMRGSEAPREHPTTKLSTFSATFYPTQSGPKKLKHIDGQKLATKIKAFQIPIPIYVAIRWLGALRSRWARAWHAPRADRASTSSRTAIPKKFVGININEFLLVYEGIVS